MKILVNKKLLLPAILVIIPLSIGHCSETAEQLQKKLRTAEAEIESLKGKIAAMQGQVELARVKNELPPARPLEQALAIEHPIVTAYELASYAQADKDIVQKLLKGKVVSVTGSVERFTTGISRNFRIFLNTNGALFQVGGAFNATSSTKSVYTKEDGAELAIDSENRGLNVFAALNDKIVITGFFSGVGRRQVALSDCVLQKQ